MADADELQLNVQYACKMAHQCHVSSKKYQAAAERLGDALKLVDRQQRASSWRALSSGGFIKLQGEQSVALNQELNEAKRSQAIALEQMTLAQRRLKTAPWSEIGQELSTAVLSQVNH